MRRAIRWAIWVVPAPTNDWAYAHSTWLLNDHGPVVRKEFDSRQHAEAVAEDFNMGNRSWSYAVWPIAFEEVES